MKKIFRGPPLAPKKADFGRTEAEMGRFSHKGLRYSFGILHGLLSNKNIWGIPPTPPINPILTEKWRNLVKSTLHTCMPENFC